MNKTEFLKQAKEQGLKSSNDIAQAFGISPQVLSLRLSGKRLVTRDFILKAISVLKLTEHKTIEIFFPETIKTVFDPTPEN